MSGMFFQVCKGQCIPLRQRILPRQDHPDGAFRPGQLDKIAAGQRRGRNDQIAVIVAVAAAALVVRVAVVVQLQFRVQALELREKVRRQLLQKAHEIPDAQLGLGVEAVEL